MDGQRNDARGPKEPATSVVPTQQDFLFVDASKSTKGSQQGRRNARSFVMQKARRENPWSTSKHVAKLRKTTGSKSPKNKSPVTAEPPDLSHTSITSTPSPPMVASGTRSSSSALSRFSVEKRELCTECQILFCQPGHHLCPRCLLLQPPTPPEGVDNRLFDPFRTASVETNSSVSELLDHFVSEMAPSTIAVDIRNRSNLMKSDWFGTALGNPGFMHSLLCTAALHLYIVGRGSMETILHHRAEAIAAVNLAISSLDPDRAISDANVGAVFNLLCVEESLFLPYFQDERSHDDGPNQREIHLNGLRSMLKMRGGLQAIKSNRILQAFILWHSTAHAIASFEVPYLSTIDRVTTLCFPKHPTGYLPDFSHHLLECCRAVGVKDTLTSLVQSSLTLIADLNAWFEDPDSPLDPLSIQNYSCVLECMLMQWLRDYAGLTNPFEDALCVALLIFTVRVTEALQRRADIHSLHFVASKRLEKALNATSHAEWIRCPDLLLWILAIGAISAEGSPESLWFVYQVSLACDEFGIYAPETLLRRLHLCGWVSFKLDQSVYSLWDSIINLRLEPFLTKTNTGGPLQSQVSEPDFIDWQNVDWLASANHSLGLAGIGDLSKGEEEGLYASGASYIYPPQPPPSASSHGINWWNI